MSILNYVEHKPDNIDNPIFFNTYQMNLIENTAFQGRCFLKFQNLENENIIKYRRLYWANEYSKKYAIARFEKNVNDSAYGGLHNEVYYLTKRDPAQKQIFYYNSNVNNKEHNFYTTGGTVNFVSQSGGYADAGRPPRYEWYLVPDKYSYSGYRTEKRLVSKGRNASNGANGRTIKANFNIRFPHLNNWEMTNCNVTVRGGSRGTAVNWRITGNPGNGGVLQIFIPFPFIIHFNSITFTENELSDGEVIIDQKFTELITALKGGIYKSKTDIRQEAHVYGLMEEW